MTVLWIAFGVLILAVAFAIGVLFYLFRRVIYSSQRDSQKDIDFIKALGEIKDRMADLSGRTEARISNELHQVRGSLEKSSSLMHEQIKNFTSGVVSVQNSLEKINVSMRDISTFQDIFRSPKLRGEWGEASLEHLLSQHFPQELYQLQYEFSSGERVDAVLKLPNGRLLSIDSKFPSENFEKMVHAVSDDERNVFKKIFLQDAKNKVDEIAGKYILPNENTLDIAFMYVPAEAVYYEMIVNLDREFNFGSYAWSKKVIPVSPNNLFLNITMVEHWFRDTQISKQTQIILKKLNQVLQDSEKLSDSFRKLGKHIENTKSMYDYSEKRLDLMVGRVGRLIGKVDVDESVEPKIEDPSEKNLSSEN